MRFRFVLEPARPKPGEGGDSSGQVTLDDGRRAKGREDVCRERCENRLSYPVTLRAALALCAHGGEVLRLWLQCVPRHVSCALEEHLWRGGICRGGWGESGSGPGTRGSPPANFRSQMRLILTQELSQTTGSADRHIGGPDASVEVRPVTVHLNGVSVGTSLLQLQEASISITGEEGVDPSLEGVDYSPRSSSLDEDEVKGGFRSGHGRLLSDRVAGVATRFPELGGKLRESGCQEGIEQGCKERCAPFYHA